jgi:hypothetical protein
VSEAAKVLNTLPWWSQPILDLGFWSDSWIAG